MYSNYRPLKGWRRWLFYTFSEYRWARRLIGGRWERWLIDVVGAPVWEPVTGFSSNQRPSPLAICKLEEEEW